MKLFVVALMVTSSAFAQRSLDPLARLQTGADSSSRPGAPSVVRDPTPGPVVSTGGAAVSCLSENQNNVPLRQMLNLLQQSGGKLSVEHDHAEGTVTIRGGNMISNCNSMLNLTLAAPTEAFPHYVVEVGFRAGPYNVVQKNAVGDVVSLPNQSYPASFSGFLQCLEATGVMRPDPANPQSMITDPSKIVYEEFVETRDGAHQSGDVLFAGNRPLASQSAYSNGIVARNGCTNYERINSEPVNLYSAQQRRREGVMSDLRVACDTGSIEDLVSLQNRFGADFEAIRPALMSRLIADMRALGETLRAEDSEESPDFSVLEHFNREVIEPKVAAIDRLYQLIRALPAGSRARRLKERELRDLTDELAKFSADPFPTEADLNTLLATGKFDDAEQLKNIHLTIEHYSRVGLGTLSPGQAAREVRRDRESFEDRLPRIRYSYDVRTGRRTGQAARYTREAQRLRTQITEFERSLQLQVAEETQRCQRVQQTYQQCMQRLARHVQSEGERLVRIRTRYGEDIAELEARAVELTTWEAEGRTYVEARGGRVTPATSDEPALPARQDSIAPPSRFDFTASAGAQGVPAATNPGWAGGVAPQFLQMLTGASGAQGQQQGFQQSYQPWQQQQGFQQSYQPWQQQQGYQQSYQPWQQQQGYQQGYQPWQQQQGYQQGSQPWQQQQGYQQGSQPWQQQGFGINYGMNLGFGNQSGMQTGVQSGMQNPGGFNFGQ